YIPREDQGATIDALEANTIRFSVTEIANLVRGRDRRIGGVLKIEVVGVSAAKHSVAPAFSIDGVGSSFAAYAVVAQAARQIVIPIAGQNGIVSAIGVNGVLPVIADESVVADIRAGDVLKPSDYVDTG